MGRLRASLAALRVDREGVLAALADMRAEIFNDKTVVSECRRDDEEAWRCGWWG